MREFIQIVEDSMSRPVVPRNAGPGHNQGFDVDAFHGTHKDFDAFKMGQNGRGSSGSREGKLGFWFTDNPDTATSFADWSARGQAGANVMPVRLSLRNPLIVHSYDEIRDLVDRFTTFRKPDYVIGGRQIRMTDDVVDYDAARQWLKDQGYDGIALLNTHTDSPSDDTRINQYVVLDPSQIRSRFAKFDPDKAHSADITEETLTELFDKPVAIKWRYRNENDWSGDFAINDVRFNVHFGNSYRPDCDNWIVVFSCKFVDDDGQEDEVYDNTGLMGSDSKHVLATVLSAIREFLSERKPDMLIFAADKGSQKGVEGRGQGRASVYAMIAKRCASQLQKDGYTVERHGGEEEDTFFITRQ